ncbi:MAG: tRNA 2-thiouridine(34) synthase MnmA [Phycisphaerales bacterium]|nr:tRNA 2-thiouridine(34) synthase MnmA [Phycisphaerales bacterium]
MSKLGKVLVAMSGGIDSTITAIMLHQQGYEVVGITMKTWDYATSRVQGKETGCCNLDSFNDARQVAVDFGFPHYILDIREEFNSHVISNFVDEYMAGRTPNPCVMCNTHIKWRALFKRANILHCDFIATGHYAQVLLLANKRMTIAKGIDYLKDQSYVLWGLDQELLKRTIMPLGQYRKTEIRDIALQLGYEKLAKKSESYEICFIPDNNYHAFLKNQVPDIENKLQNGYFVDTNGKVIGKHQGYPFYTIGQRKGLQVAFGKPKFVVAINAETNVVVLGDEDDLLQQKMIVSKLNWMMYEYPPLSPLTLVSKIRYKDVGSMSTVQSVGTDVEVQFHSPVKSIAKGQSAVFYQDNMIVAGGVIATSFLN